MARDWNVPQRFGDADNGGFTALGPAIHALLRAGAGLLFMEHGLQKLFGALGGFGGTPGATAPLASLMGVAGVLELCGGLLLIAGLATRAVAVILVIEMVVAFFMAHFPRGGWPVQNAGELALLYALVFGFLAANGPGPFSIDAVIRSRAWKHRKTGA
jgi:putative oxidoreductase